MAVIKPFKAWRSNADNVLTNSCVPYDIINTEEAKILSKDKPNSFLHVIRPEIDLPNSIDIYDELVYQKGKENLYELLHSKEFFQEETEELYIYRLTWKGKIKTGVFGCVSVKEYDHEIIRKHELTRPDKENDRTKHILTQQAHAEPVMLTYEDDSSISNLIKDDILSEPIYDFISEDEVRHTLWRSSNKESLIHAFTDVSKFYIADGHHRCASASRAAHELEQLNTTHTGKEEYNFFPAVLFPKSETQILAYNRIIYKLPTDFYDRLSSTFDLIKGANPIPAIKGGISMYFGGNWYGLTLPESASESIVCQLDISRLQEFILEPFLDIANQRTDENLYFIGGIKGTKEMEKLVDLGEAELCISMYPTSINELIQVSDAGLLMPPKSTWFEPKLRSGLLIHTF